MLGAPARLIIAGTKSASGKTTLTCGLIEVLRRRGLKVAAAKCGPDYLDVGFHTKVLGVPSRNLDLFLSDATFVRRQVAASEASSDVTLIEGVMGYYDGRANSTQASTYGVACVTETPVVLVVDGRGRSLSAAAEVAGFAHFREPSHIAAIIVNHARPHTFAQLKGIIERECSIPVVGYMPEVEEASLEHRHLGLVSADEVDDLRERVSKLADVLERTIDIDRLLEVARLAPALEVKEPPIEPLCGDAPLIAVARDAAFSFTYHETVELLRQLGADIAYFSPLEDEALPQGTAALLLSGGYPELHAADLTANTSMLSSIRAAIAGGVPTIAECGGFMYLLEAIEDIDGHLHTMVGIISGEAKRGRCLRHFGYEELCCQRSGLLADAGQTLRAHEFHYWQATDEGNAFKAQKRPSRKTWDCVHMSDTLYAGFPHLYLAGSPQVARRFVRAAASYAKGRVPCS